MEYSKDIVLDFDYKNTSEEKKIKKQSKLLKLLKKHKFVATISALCGILMILDYVFVCNFITLLQKI
jgi:hypothetical protein